MINDKKVIFSGAQPSGILTLGNYLGALKNWVELQEDHYCYYCVVDLHAITVRQEPALLRQRCLDTAAIYMASGIDPEKSVLFIQSHVPAHAEMNWVLNCYTYIGELTRMTQFKDKSAKHQDNLNSGLLTYPVLMAGDILLYNTDLVPVGSDQKQHIEITRDIAERFNNIYGDVFTIPEPYIPKNGARIMSLQEPNFKMSKSDPNENAFISIIDNPDVIRRKIKRAVTDSEAVIAFDPENKPGVSNLLTIYAACKSMTMEDTLKVFDGLNYGALKEGVSEAVIEKLAPLQDKYNEIRKDKQYLLNVLHEGAEKAKAHANRTMRKVYKKIGYIER